MSAITYEQVEAYMAQKCAEASQAANGDYVCLKVEAICSKGQQQITVQPIGYTQELGHYGLSEFDRPQNLDDCIAWITKRGGPQLAKEKRDLAAQLIAEADALEKGAA